MQAGTNNIYTAALKTHSNVYSVIIKQTNNYVHTGKNVYE